MIPKKILALAVALGPTTLSAEGFDVGISYSQETGTITSGTTVIDMDVNGYALGASIDVSDNVFLSLAYGSGNAKATVSGASVDLDMSASQIGVGYYISNDLNEMAGTGSANGIGLALQSSEVSVGSISQKVNGESLIYAASFAVAPGVTTSISASTPFDSFGSSYGMDLSLGYYFSDKTALSISYGIGKADDDGTKTDTSDFGIGLSFMN